MPCCSDDGCASSATRQTGQYRGVLWIVLVINASMFLIEIIAGLAAGSTALQADALDFFADAANYGISLFVLGMSLRWRASAALVKGASMGFFGLWVIGSVIWHTLNGAVPGWGTMGVVGSIALAANAACLALLYAWREGDANKRSVWICSRNDVIANLAVLAAALGVFGTGTGWPDIIVASVMAVLALQGAATILRQSLFELRDDRRISLLPSPR
ncbi:cation transporter [Jiella marina]|uniref:cation transporter n=1 Tax=Jiella sp. LLJ827 TaxID=2917712 RepID=UPI002101C22C|nr:cation transporter [Jiella sp. LLJ827]MCQ0990358.1 cation transporter [Jiella sp. LLJ827]